MFGFLFGRGKKKSVTRPLLLAHRGARKVAPENTIPAFKRAIKMGFDGVEFDVVLTKDKIPVVFHGNDLSHTTRSNGLIHETPLHEIEKIDAGSLFDPHYKGEQIPTLTQVLKIMAPGNLMLNIEIKSQPGRHNGVENIVGQVIKNHDLGDRVVISSFSPLILRRFNKLFPEIRTSLLIGPNPFFFLKTLLFANMLKASSIHPVFQYTSEALVSFAQNRKWKVFVWNVNTRQEYARSVDLGVDGIITDEPELLKI